jgi:hypothetical protein
MAVSWAASGVLMLMIPGLRRKTVGDFALATVVSEE